MRDVQGRLDWAASQLGTTSWSGQCEAFTRSCFPFEAAYSSARVAWEASDADGPTHRDYDAPAGVPVFWDITYGANEAYDHVALSAGGGMCYSTSAGPGSTLALVGIADLTTRWGMTYRGWAEVYHGVRVYDPPPPPLEDDMTPDQANTLDHIAKVVDGLPDAERISEVVEKYVPRAEFTAYSAGGAEETINVADAFRRTLNSLNELKAALHDVQDWLAAHVVDDELELDE